MSKYRIDTKKFYRIWFSKNRDSFLNVENQIRLAAMRYANPQTNISVVYSSKLLSEKAKKEMAEFSKRFQVTFVDLDKEISQWIQTQKDKVLHAYVQQELEKWVKDEGGNCAVASDIVRWIECVIEKLGIYTDFDVYVNSQGKMEDSYLSEAPILYPVKHTETEGTTTNNDFIACATDENDKINPEALKKINFVQNEIIKRINDIEYALSKNVVKGYANISQPDNHKMQLFIQKSSKDSNGKLDIYKLRKRILSMKPIDMFILQNMEEDLKYIFLDEREDFINKKCSDWYFFARPKDSHLKSKKTDKEIASYLVESIKNRLMVTSIQSIAHAPVMAIYHDMDLKYLKDAPLYGRFEDFTKNQQQDYLKLSKIMLKHSVYDNEIINFIWMEPKPFFVIGSELNDYKNVGNLGDCSWSSVGAEKSKTREKMLLDKMPLEDWFEYVKDAKGNIGSADLALTPKVRKSLYNILIENSEINIFMISYILHMAHNTFPPNLFKSFNEEFQHYVRENFENAKIKMQELELVDKEYRLIPELKAFIKAGGIKYDWSGNIIINKSSRLEK